MQRIDGHNRLSNRLHGVPDRQVVVEARRECVEFVKEINWVYVTLPLQLRSKKIDRGLLDGVLPDDARGAARGRTLYSDCVAIIAVFHPVCLTDIVEVC